MSPSRTAAAPGFYRDSGLVRRPEAVLGEFLAERPVYLWLLPFAELVQQIRIG